MVIGDEKPAQRTPKIRQLDSCKRFTARGEPLAPPLRFFRSELSTKQSRVPQVLMAFNRDASAREGPGAPIYRPSPLIHWPARITDTASNYCKARAHPQLRRPRSLLHNCVPPPNDDRSLMSASQGSAGNGDSTGRVP